MQYNIYKKQITVILIMPNLNIYCLKYIYKLEIPSCQSKDLKLQYKRITKLMEVIIKVD